MQINLTITVKGIAADSHANAKAQAWNALHYDMHMHQNLRRIGMETVADFEAHAKSYREADGSFTVTIP